MKNEDESDLLNYCQDGMKQEQQENEEIMTKEMIAERFALLQQYINNNNEDDEEDNDNEHFLDDIDENYDNTTSLSPTKRDLDDEYEEAQRYIFAQNRCIPPKIWPGHYGSY